MNKIKELVNKIDGWLTEREGKLLYNLAKNCRGKGVIVEIGSWKGRSTIWLGQGSKQGNNVEIYAIDPHTGASEHKDLYEKVWTFEEFKNNIKNARVDDIVIPIVKTSEEVAKSFNEPVELIFIDGAHEYDLVKLDFKKWFPKVINGGVMAFHDTIGGWPGPKKVAEEFVYKSKNFRNVGFIDSITFAEKVKQNSITDRIKNRYTLLLKRLKEYDQRNPLPKPIKMIGKKILKPKES